MGSLFQELKRSSVYKVVAVYAVVTWVVIQVADTVLRTLQTSRCSYLANVRKLVILLFVFFPHYLFAQIILNAGVGNQTPQGNLVEISGVYIVEEGEDMGWYYDWGDETQSTGSFPTLHRYQQPGTYTVTVRGYNDRGNQAVFSFDHTVSTPFPTDVASVTLAAYGLTMRDGESKSIEVVALDENGSPISMVGRSVEITPIRDLDRLDIQYLDDAIQVSAPVLESHDAWMSRYYVTVDGVEAAKPLSILVSKHVEGLESLIGEHILADLPSEFFSLDIPLDDFQKIFDLAFEAENESVHERYFSGEKLYEGISYEPPNYGTNGSPLSLGDSAKPQNTAGDLPIYWSIIFHELGHNFSGTQLLFGTLGVPGAFYQETIAEWYVQFVIDRLLTRGAAEFSAKTLQYLEQLRQGGRDYHEDEWQSYIENGKQFEYEQTGGGSHPLVQLIYSYSDIYGWDRITVFLEQFDHTRMEKYSELISSYGGKTTENRVTLMAAALAATFGTHVKADFEQLNFPLNEEFYSALIMDGGLPQPLPPPKIAVNSDQSDPSGEIYGGVTKDGGNTYTDDLKVGDDLQIVVVIEPDSQNLGDSVELFVIIFDGVNFFQVTTPGLVDFTGEVENLISFDEIVLTETNWVDILEPFGSVITVTTAEIGNYSFFVGYTSGDGVITYNDRAIELNITN